MKTRQNSQEMSYPWIGILIIIATITLPSAASAVTVFSDNMSTGANWTIRQTPDSSAQFGYDYSQKGLPPAPSGGGDTIGLKLEANNNLPTGVEQIVAYNANAAYSGKYTVRADVWINWALVGGGTGTGSTEYAGISVGHDGTGPTLSGATLLYDGDGDATPTDYVLYKGASQIGAFDNLQAPIAQAFPSINVASAVPTQGQTGATLVGAGGFQWMMLNAEVDTTFNGNLGFARFSMRSAASGKTVEIGTIDNSTGPVVPLSGGIALQMFDMFPSVTANPAFSFAIIDNVQVLEGLVPLPEPASGTLFIFAVLIQLCRRRRTIASRW